MSVLRLVTQELAHRKWSYLLSLLGMSATVALFVAFLTTAEAARRETRRVTRDIGFNLRIIPKEADMDRFWEQGFSDLTLPETVVQRLASYDGVFFSYNHLVPTLQKRFPVGGKEAVLTGLAPTITSEDKKKRPMGFQIEAGTLHLGFQVAHRLGLKRGDRLDLAGQPFQIARCLVESGTDEDIRIYGALPDVQAILGLPGRITEIQAIDCLCLTSDEDPLTTLRAELAKILPEAKVIQLRAIADARARQRQTAERTFGFLSPVLLVACVAWVGVLAALNVRERRTEVGVLRALGKNSGWIAALFLAKAVAIGVVGAAVGYTAGTVLALWFGPQIFQITAKAIRADYALLGWSLLAAPLLAALASFIPATLAVTLDPAEALREE